jgi:hypothetical protein
MIVVGIISIRSVFYGKAQTELISDLSQRLTQEGVPLKGIKILNQKPYDIEITLVRSKSKNE